MRNFFQVIAIIFCFHFLTSALAQDTIITWKKKYIPAKIISLNRTTLQFIPWNDTTGEIRRWPVSELKKIKYRSGEIVNMNTWQKQSGLGLTYFIFPLSSHSSEKSNADLQFQSSGLLLSYYYRGHVAALVISAGYAHTAFNYVSHEHNKFSGLYYDRTSSYDSKNFSVQITPRIYTNIRNVSPFFDLVLGLEFYSASDTNGIVPTTVPTLVEPGFGLQFRLFKNWMGEGKAGLCRRSDLKNSDLAIVPDLKISFYRIIYSHITRI